MIWILMIIEAGLAGGVIWFYMEYKKQNDRSLFFRYDGKKLSWQKYFVPFGYGIIRKIPVRYEETKGKALYVSFKQITEETDTKQAYRIYLAQKAGTVTGAVLLCIGLLIVILLTAKKQEVFSPQLYRAAYEEGDRYLQVRAEVGTETEQYEAEMKITIPQQEMSQEEKEGWLGSGAEYIQSVFQEHEPYTQNPQFPASWGKVYFAYSSMEPEIMRNDGHLLIPWPQNERTVAFQVTVWAEDLHTSVPTVVRLAAAKELSLQRQWEIVQQSIEGGEYLEETTLILPERTVGGEKITWSQQEEGVNPWLWLGGSGAILLLLWIQQDERLREKIRTQQARTLQVYPEMINEVAILMGAGLTLQNAWFRITDKYQRKKEETGKREPLYEAMVYTSIRIQNGLSFAEALKEFGDRTRVKEVRKFAGLMLSDRKRGDEHLLRYLNDMNEEAWEQKKKLVKEKTEEADTRLLLPLMMMLVVILVVVLAPAIMTIRG